MDDTFKKISIGVIFLALVVLAFFLLKPLLLSIIFGIILAFTLTPVYEWFYKKIKSANLSAAIVCFLVLIIIVLPIILLTPALIDQSVKLYISSQKIDFLSLFEKIFPNLFTLEEFSSEIASVIHSFVLNITNSLMNSFSKLILNFPTILLQSIIVFFTFFFALRDRNELLVYIKSLLPFPKEIEEKLFTASKEITSSVIYGQILIGMIQGFIVGIGFFIFGVPNGLLLTLLVTLAGILPIVGPALIWIPVVIYLLMSGNILTVFGVTIFGIVSSMSDNFLRPFFVSRRTRLHPAIVIIGMIGGFLLFGILGFILGPLTLAYLIIIVEIYRNRKISGILIQQEEKK